MIVKGNKTVSTLGWGAVLAWFGGSLLSQAAFIGKYGQPYDATELLTSLGQWSWLIVTIELGIWLTVGVLVTQRFYSSSANGAST